MLQPVHMGRKSPADYATLVSRSLMQELRRLAEPLQGRRVVHISPTASTRTAIRMCASSATSTTSAPSRVNAFQARSDASLQKSIKEGFGLTVTEALLKARPTVAGRVGGIVAGITDGETGWLLDSPDECAEAPRLLHDWLVLFNMLLDTGLETTEPVRIPASAPA